MIFQFHSDSERGLGPVVASLSLGSAALMHFRPRAQSKDTKHQPIALTLALRHVSRVAQSAVIDLSVTRETY